MHFGLRTAIKIHDGKALSTLNEALHDLHRTHLACKSTLLPFIREMFAQCREYKFFTASSVNIYCYLPFYVTVLFILILEEIFP